jgi:hypothetical protein
MKKLTFVRGALMLPVALVCLFASANASGATIDLSTLLTNPGFESGNTGSGCPVAYTCGGSPTPGFTSYVVSSAQYTAGADGLSGGRIVPGGTQAASSPTPSEGSGTLMQTGLGTYAAGNTYTLNLWVGTPLTVPNAGGTAAPVGTITAYFLGNGSQVSAVSLAAPTIGQWVLDPLSFAPTGIAIGETIGFELFVNGTPVGGGSGNNAVANFDIVTAVTPPPTPEPASIALLGGGLLGLAVLRRRRSRS